MPFSLRCIQYFTTPAIHVWCKMFAHGRGSVVDEEEPSRRIVSTTDATIAAVNSLMRSNRRVIGNLHECGRYTLKTKHICLTFKHICLLDLFTFLV